MTDRIYALTVVLEQDTRDDDCESLIAAISQLRRVISVATHVTNLEVYAARQRAVHELRGKLFKVLE